MASKRIKIGSAIRTIRDVTDKLHGGNIVDLSVYQDQIFVINSLLTGANEKLRIDDKSDAKSLKNALEAIEKIGDLNRDNEVEIVGAQKLDDKNIIDGITLQQLLDDLDEYETEKAIRQGRMDARLEELVKKYGVSQIEVQKLIERKVKLQAEAEKKIVQQAKTLSPEEVVIVADSLSDLQLKIEAELKENGTANDRAEEIAESVVTDKEVLEKIVDIKPQMSEVEAEVVRVLKKEGIKKETVEIVEQSRMAVAKVVVDRETEKIVASFVADLETKIIDSSTPLTTIEREAVEQIVRNRIRGVVINDGARLSEIPTETDDDGKIVAGKPIAEEISELIPEQKINKDRLKELGGVIKQSDEMMMVMMEERMDMVGEVRRESIKHTVVRDILMANGNENVSFKYAHEMAVQVARLEYGPEAGSTVGSEREIDKLRQENIINGGSVKAKLNEARSYANMVKSVVHGKRPVPQIIEEFRESSKRIPVFARNRHLQSANRLIGILESNPALQKSFEMVRRYNVFRQNLPGQISRRLMSGVVSRIPPQLMANATAFVARLGLSSQTLSVLAGGFFNGALSKAITAGVTKVAGSIAMKAGIALGTGPVGWAATALMMAAEWVADKVLSVANKVAGKLNEITGSFGADFTKGLRNSWSKVRVVPIVGGLLEKTGDALISVANFIVFAVGVGLSALIAAPIAIVVIGTLVLFGGMNILTGGMVSSLVPPIGIGGGNVTMIDERPPDGWQTTPIPLPDWNGGEIAIGCPQGLPVSGGRITQGPFAPGCSHAKMSSPAIDIGVAGGTPIRAINDGLATSHYDSQGYGYYVTVQAKCGNTPYSTLYAHMIALPFPQGAQKQVKKGDVIGFVDNTGNSTGNHIHLGGAGLSASDFMKGLGADYNKAQRLYKCCIDNGKACPSL